MTKKTYLKQCKLDKFRFWTCKRSISRGHKYQPVVVFWLFKGGYISKGILLTVIWPKFKHENCSNFKILGVSQTLDRRKITKCSNLNLNLISIGSTLNLKLLSCSLDGFTNSRFKILKFYDFLGYFQSWSLSKHVFQNKIDWKIAFF